jgi:pimeloyl-ACP methyl ester carboxylesterase
VPLVRTLDFDCWYEDDCFAPPWAPAPVVLVQHGFGRNAEYWRHWVPLLAGAHRVLRRDLRAHGGSTAGAPDHQWSVEGLAADVVAFLDALGLDRVHYVGESVGGITGIALGALHPERFHTITLVQSPIRLDVVGELMRGEFPSWSAALRTLGAGGWVSRNMPAGDPRTAWERDQWDRCDLDALCALADVTPLVDVEHLLPQVAVPTLVLAPAESPLTPFADQLQLRTTIPDAEIEVFEGRGHTIYTDEPERCTARLAGFVARHPSP